MITTEPLPGAKILKIYETLWKEKGSDYIMEKLVEEMASFIEAILATRHNNVTFSYAVFEGMAKVEVYLEILRMQLCMFPQSNGTGCLYDDVIEIKKRVNQELQNSITKENLPEMPNCPYRKRETDLGCPCEDNVEIQPCQKLLNILGPVQKMEGPRGEQG